MTDVLEIHFLEIEKLRKLEQLEDKDENVIRWLKFLDAKTRGEMEMLAKKDKDIEKAYKVLQAMSQSKEKRMAYEARQAELMDQRTREKTAREQGIQQEKMLMAKKLLVKGMSIDEVISITELAKEQVEAIIVQKQ